MQTITTKKRVLKNIFAVIAGVIAGLAAECAILIFLLNGAPDSSNTPADQMGWLSLLLPPALGGLIAYIVASVWTNQKRYPVIAYVIAVLIPVVFYLLLRF